MAIRKVIEIGDEQLRKQSRNVEKFNTRLHLILSDMADTMYHQNGVGLAAPQIGILRRICVVDIQEEGEKNLIEFINPVIVEQEGEQLGLEGCLSVPGKYGEVSRPLKIKVQAQDRHGNPFELEAEGFLARAICHEIDHLNGTLYVDIMEKEVLPQELEAMQKRRRKAREN